MLRRRARVQIDGIEHLDFRIHAQLVGRFQSLFTSRTRRRIEMWTAVIATHLLLLCCLLHVSFVHGARTSNCLAPYFAALPSHTRAGSSRHIGPHDARHVLVRIQVAPDDAPRLTALEQALEAQSFVFAGHKALLALLDLEEQQHSAGAGAGSDSDTAKHFMRSEALVLPRSSPCFAFAGVGHDVELLSLVVRDAIGYDTILMNHLVAHFGATGALYSEAHQTTTELRAKSVFSATGASESWLQFVVRKVHVALAIAVLFFVLTAFVALVLQEALSCIAMFIALHQDRSQLQIRSSSVVLALFARSLVPVPVVLGMLFFLAELYSDRVLALAVLSLAWLGESFAVVSVRTRLAQMYFPPLFFCVFAALHVYILSFPLGFTIVASGAALAVLVLIALFFLNTLEVPALRRGDVSERRPREPLFPVR